MLSNKWHFSFDHNSHSISFAIHSWSPEKNKYMRKFNRQYSQRQFELMFEMIETAYLLSLIEVKD
jgi:hypothetical protein